MSTFAKQKLMLRLNKVAVVIDITTEAGVAGGD